jgi:uncharacterized protein YndB with AHSA1/START domain
MPEYPHHLERTVQIGAAPEAVFCFFTDSERWARWWGAGSTIDARPGGKVYIRHANGVEVLGEVLEALAPERIVFMYGFAGGTPVPPGGSRVTASLEPDEAGTLLRLRHEFAEAGPRDAHVQGWRFHLSVLGNAVADEAYSGAANAVDAWFAAWATADAGLREQALAAIAAPQIRYRDRFSLLDGMADLTEHIAAAQHFMPGIRLERKGDIRHCQGTVLADWIATDGDGTERMAGTNVFIFAPDCRIASVTGLGNR